MNYKLLGVLILALCTMCLPLQADDFKGVEVEVVPGLGGAVPSYGFYDMEFRIANRRPEDVNITLLVKLENNTVTNQVERTVMVPKNSTQYVNLSMPVYGKNNYYRSHYGTVGGDKLQLWLNGSYGEMPLPSIYMEDNIVLAAPECGAFNLDKILPMNYANLVVSPLDLRQWPRRVQSYLGYKVIMLNADQLPPPEVMNVLQKYVKMGGTLLLIVGDNTVNVPDGLTGENLSVTQNLGWGKICYLRLFKPGAITAWQNLAPTDFQRHELERVQEYVNFDELNRLLNTQNTNWGLATAPLSVPDIKLPDMPLNIVLWVLAGFVLLIGPVNYGILKWRKKELYMLITTPVLSLLFCAAVIITVSINEGWYSRGVGRAALWLDQTTGEALSYGRFKLYSPLNIPGGFDFEYSDLPLFEQYEKMRLNTTRNNHYAADIVSPRIQSEYCVVRLAGQSEKLRFYRTDDKQKIEVVNGLGTVLTQLVFRDENGWFFYHTGVIPPGSRAVMVLDHRYSESYDPGEAPFYNASSLLDSEAGNWLSLARSFCVENSYVAETLMPAMINPGYVPEEFEFKMVVFGKTAGVEQ